MVARAAVIFAAVIVAGVFLNLYMFVGIIVLTPVLGFLGISSEFLLTPLYVICLFAGIVTTCIVMRPAWIAISKQPQAR